MLTSSGKSVATKNSTIVRSKNQVRLTRAALQTAYVVSDDFGAKVAERLFTSPRRHRRPAREQAILDRASPFTVEVQLRSPGWHWQRRLLQAWRWGVGSVTGPTVLLVHGWEGRGAQLGAFVEPLVAAGLSVVAFDAPGHGDSPGGQLYLTDLADCVVDVVRHLERGGAHLHGIVAHSFGCAAVALAHERGGIDAAHNVMVSPNVIIRDSIARFVAHTGLDPDEAARFEDRVAAHTGTPLAGYDLPTLVGGRDSALLVVHDAGDQEVPLRHGEALVAAWPGAALVVTEGLGHRKILRDASVLQAAVAHVAQAFARSSSDFIRRIEPELEAMELGGLVE